MSKLNDKICVGFGEMTKDAAFNMAFAIITPLMDPNDLVIANSDDLPEGPDDDDSLNGYGSYTEGGMAQCQALYD